MELHKLQQLCYQSVSANPLPYFSYVRNKFWERESLESLRDTLNILLDFFFFISFLPYWNYLIYSCRNKAEIQLHSNDEKSTEELWQMGVIKFPTPGSQYNLNIAAHIMSQNIVMKHSPKAFKRHWKEGNDVPLQNEQFFFFFLGQLMTGVLQHRASKCLCPPVPKRKRSWNWSNVGKIF